MDLQSQIHIIRRSDMRDVTLDAVYYAEITASVSWKYLWLYTYLRRPSEESLLNGDRRESDGKNSNSNNVTK
jgi:hypothetical protein